MSNLLGRRNLYGALCMSLCMASGATNAKAKQNVISDIFHHKGHAQQKDLELGKVVFYFQQRPQVHSQTIAQTTGMHELLLTLPETTAVKKFCDFTGEQQCCHGKTMYRVCVKKSVDVQKKETIQVVIQYDAQRVVPEYALFDAITQDKGLVVRFHNKELINRMQRHEDSALRVAMIGKRPAVIIDAGHGGDDHGAIGCNNVAEKFVTLAIGKDVATCLAHYGVASYLTREEDVFVPLDVRTTFANQHDALLFVSIHANSGARRESSGIETYCLSSKLFLNSTTLDAACSNQLCMARDTLYTQSGALAQAIQKHALKEANAWCGESVCDRRVKYSVAQVLLGVAMPSVLIEVGFLSNPREAAYLASAHYRAALARGIADGIYEHLNTIARA